MDAQRQKKGFVKKQQQIEGKEKILTFLNNYLKQECVL